MSERPILFSAPMVRAILGGNKTQTRRVAKVFAGRPELDAILKRYPNQSGCPYGVPGDGLWVREGFSGPHHQERHPPRDWHVTDQIHYWADGNPADGDWTKPRPGMFMPRWASRIALEVTGVRVERLHDISEADAVAEGITYHDRMQGFHTEEGRHFHCTDPRQSYAGLWEQINGPGSWDANTFVWVVEFRRTA